LYYSILIIKVFNKNTKLKYGIWVKKKKKKTKKKKKKKKKKKCNWLFIHVYESLLKKNKQNYYIKIKKKILSKI